MVFLDFISFVQGVRDPSLVDERALVDEPWLTSLGGRALMSSLDVEP